MLSSSLNTGSTDLRETDVQHPNTTATFSLVMSSRAFSANSGQLEAGSTTTASSFLPRTPPFLFCSSMSISMTSLSVVSLIAIVPESEWRMPILIVSSALAAKAPSATAPPTNAPAARNKNRLENDMRDPVFETPVHPAEVDVRCGTERRRKAYATKKMGLPALRGDQYSNFY